MLLTSFVLNRLAQLGNQSSIDLVMKSLNVLYPVFREVVTYVSKAAINLHPNKRKALGAKLLNLLDEAVPGHLEYHRCWILNVFAESDKWDNESSLAKVKPTGWSESFSRRELILRAGGRAQILVQGREAQRRQPTSLGTEGVHLRRELPAGGRAEALVGELEEERQAGRT